MKPLTLMLALFLIAPGLFADDRDIDYDHQTDFLKFKTFVLREGELNSKTPTLQSPLVRKKIDEAIRAQLTAKGLREVQSQADLVVTYRFSSFRGTAAWSFPAGRRGRRTRVERIKFTEGTLAVDLTSREQSSLVWRGVYRDDESDPSKISEKLPNDIKKLFSDYPPKKK